MIDISDMPEYGPAMAKYRTDKAQAQENGEAVDVANVEAAWANTKLELTQTKVARDSATMATQGALAAVQAQFPNVPAEVYSHLTDPEQIKSVAAQVAERMGPPPPPAPPAEQQGGTWGGSPGSVGGGATQGQPSAEDPAQVVERLRPTVLSKGAAARAENEQFRKGVFASTVLAGYEEGTPKR